MADMNEEEQASRKGGKSVSDLKGVQDIRTGISKRIRSMPNRQDKYYLDLYLLQKEQQRLTQEARGIRNRQRRVRERIAESRREVATQEEKALQEMTILKEGAQGEPTQQQDGPETKRKDKYNKDEWKTMSLEY